MLGSLLPACDSLARGVPSHPAAPHRAARGEAQEPPRTLLALQGQGAGRGCRPLPSPEKLKLCLGFLFLLLLLLTRLAQGHECLSL